MAALLNIFENRKISLLFLVLTIGCHVTTVRGDVAMTGFIKQPTRIGRALLDTGRAVSANSVAYRGGGLGGGVQPPPPNSEGPPKSCQTQPDCENC